MSHFALHRGIKSGQIYVLVPFYEGLPELSRCIRSLKNQTIDYTAVFVDDCSATSTHQAVEKKLEPDPRFVLLRRGERGGPAAARATGLDYIVKDSACEHDIIVLVDGDDRMLRDTALQIIADTYREQPTLKMTFGASLTHTGERTHTKTYQNWHLHGGLVRHLISWRGDHPRTFKVEHFKACRKYMRWSFPNGQWLRGATDIALILPMLERCSTDEVLHIDTTLYEYRTSRYDGRSTHHKAGGRAQQLASEYFVRKSLIFSIWKTLRYPRRTAMILRHLLGL